MAVWYNVRTCLPSVETGHEVLIWVSDGIQVWSNWYEEWHPAVSRKMGATHWCYRYTDVPPIAPLGENSSYTAN